MAIMSAAKATGWAWKLPPRDRAVLVREEDRIVGDRTGLDRQGARGIGEQVERTRPSPAAGSGSCRGPAPCRSRPWLARISLPSSRPRICGGDADLAGLAAHP